MTEPMTTTPDATATADAANQNAADATSGGSQTNSSDYEARLRAGGDFAIGEAKKQQSRADRAEGQVRELSQRIAKLEPYFRRGLDGDALAQSLGTLETMLQHPQMGEMVRSFVQTGEVPTMGRARNGRGDELDNDDDEYLTDDERKIRTLEGQINELRSQINQQGTSLGQQALTRHLERVASDLHLSGEKLDEVKGKLETTIRSWSSRPEGVGALRNLQSQDGEKTVRMLVMDALGPEGFREIVRADLLRENQIRGGMATDGPSAGLPGGGEPIPEFESALDALNAAQSRPEITRNTRF